MSIPKRLKVRKGARNEDRRNRIVRKREREREHERIKKAEEK